MLILLILCAYQQAAEWSVRNTDSPVPDVRLRDADGAFVGVSDQNGRIRFDANSARFPLRLTHPAYQPLIIRADQFQPNLSIILSRDAVIIDSVVSVTARSSRIERLIRELPVIRTNISAPTSTSIQLKQRFRSIPQVAVQESGSYASAPILNGFRANKLVYAVNGIRFNNAFFKSGNTPYLALINPFFFDRTAIADGGLSVLYGSDAIGGAIDMSTSEEGENALLLSYDTGNQQFTNALNTSFSFRGIQQRFGMYYTSAGDRVDGQNGNGSLSYGDDELSSSYRQFNVDYQLILPFETLDITAGIHLGEQYDATDFFRIRFRGSDRYEYQPLRYLLGFIRAHWKVTTFPQTWTLYRSGFQEFKRETRGSSNRRYDDGIQTTGFTWTGRLPGKNSSYFLGADVIHEFSNTDAAKDDQAVLSKYPDGATSTSAGLHVAGRFNTTSNLQIQSGLRYSFNQTAIPAQNVNLTRFNAAPKYDEIRHALTGSIGLRWQSGVNHFRAVLASGFRQPNFDDLAKTGEIVDHIVALPNTDLKPERSLRFTTEYRTSGSSWAGLTGFSLTSVSGLIDSESTTFNGSPTFIDGSDTLRFEWNQNLSDAVVFSTYGEFQWQSGSNLIALRAAWQYGEDVDGLPLGKIPPFSFTVDWQHDWTSTIESVLMLRYHGVQTRLSAGDQSDPRILSGGTPDALLLDLNLTYHLSPLELSLELINLTDQRYRIHASAINGTGRSVITQMIWRF